MTTNRTDREAVHECGVELTGVRFKTVCILPKGHLGFFHSSSGMLWHMNNPMNSNLVAKQATKGRK